MTFVARPLDLNNLFDHMTYESFVPGKDEINILIFDGEGGECLSSLEHETLYKVNDYQGQPTLNKGCFSVSGSIPVKVIKFQQNQSVNLLGGGLPSQLIIALSFGSFVAIVLIVAKLRSMESNEEYESSESGGSSQSLQSKASGESDEGEWAEYLDEGTGKHYYQNLHSRRVTWTKPNSGDLYSKDQDDSSVSHSDDDEVSSAEDNHGQDEWKEFFDEATGLPYYQNLISHRVTWTKPKSF